MRERIENCVRSVTWLCPYLMLMLAAAVLVWFGLSIWTAMLVALLLVCPAVMFWGVYQVRRDRSGPRSTHGTGRDGPKER